jgi:hypothetical protein
MNTNVWISGSATYNYMMNDPLLDWLNHHHKKIKTRKSGFWKHIKSVGRKEPGGDFKSHILELGYEFERKVIKFLKKRFGGDRICDIGANYKNANHWDIKYKETIEAMKKGYPIILSSMVRSYKHNIFGIPDLLVRSDWIEHITKEKTGCDNPYRKAPLLDKNKKWHYLVVDIKYSTILLRADEKHILNSNSFAAYKSQLCIYNKALGEMQGYMPNQAFLLGRRFKWTSKGVKKEQCNCFYKLGTIDYNGIDKGFVEKAFAAIAWIRDVRHETSASWNITNYPLHRWELYPNMSNVNDQPWKEVKRELAEKNKELTLLWNIGPKNRNIALKNGVNSWGQKFCTPEKLGVSGEKLKPIVSSILHINQSKKGPNMIPNRIKHNLQDWVKEGECDFFIDFEGINGSLFPISNMPKANNEEFISTVGVGFFKEKEWVFASFSIEKATYYEEGIMLENVYKYLTTKKETNVRCFHWSKAEQWMWKKALKRHPIITRDWVDFTWIDVLDIFKKEPIVLRGCFTFKLKDVAKKMYQYGYIQTTWREGANCINGLDAMIQTTNAFSTPNKTTNSCFKDIEEYNEVDVRVVAEIVAFLRLKHNTKHTSSKKRKVTEELPRKTTPKRICKKTTPYI